MLKLAATGGIRPLAALNARLRSGTQSSPRRAAAGRGGSRRAHFVVRVGVPYAVRGARYRRTVAGNPGNPAAYGLEDANSAKAMYGRMCLLSRRLIEKGVRFVQLYNAVDKLGWDGHDNNTDYHQRNAEQTDQATAALLSDLKRRGLLESTLVVWAGEFGRTPMMQGNGGRNHNPYGFTVWMAGGGTRGGTVIGSTDEIGLRAAENPQPSRTCTLRS